MSIRHPLTPAQLAARYTHRGWLWFCPVYFGALNTDCPDIAERNGVPECLLTAALWFGTLCINIAAAISPASEPGFVCVVTGELGPQTQRNSSHGNA